MARHFFFIDFFDIAMEGSQNSNIPERNHAQNPDLNTALL